MIQIGACVRYIKVSADQRKLEFRQLKTRWMMGERRVGRILDGKIREGRP